MNPKQIIAATALSLGALTFTANAAPVCDIDTSSPEAKKVPGLVAGNDNWLFREHDLITSFGPRNIGYAGLADLQTELAEHGTTLIMVPLPTRALVHPEQLGDIDYDLAAGMQGYADYLGKLREIGITIPALESLPGESDEALFFARDHHWTPAGAEAVAELVAEAIDTSLLTPATTAFTTEQTETDRNKGSYMRAANKLCGTGYTEESFPVYRTEGEYDLFAEPVAPEIVLVGTSNSNGAQHYNFAGFLKQALQHDVINLAKSGGGYHEAITEYLASDAFKDNPPKYLVWEVPGYYSLNTRSFYEKLIAAIDGAS